MTSGLDTLFLYQIKYRSITDDLFLFTHGYDYTKRKNGHERSNFYSLLSFTTGSQRIRISLFHKLTNKLCE